MIITNCPKCGSMNITTAGVCANCGWSQFAQVTTESTRITGEIELKVSGKALLDDYKRLLLENRNLKERIAELESTLSANNELLIPALKKRESEIVELSNKTISKLNKRIAELEAAQRWHVVADGELPETYKPVLTVDMSEATQVPVPAFYNPDTECWSTHFKYDLWVTHWMPLPTPPEVQE